MSSGEAVVAWVNAKERFDTARESLQQIGKQVFVTGERLADRRWRDLHPAGEPYIQGYPTGNSEFEANKWPTGEQIREALKVCHQAYRDLLKAFNALPQKEKKTLNLDRQPEP